MRGDYVASISYGKDSMAMLHVILDVLHLPLTRVVTADTFATETLLADWPDVVAFKQYADAEIKKRWGFPVEHFCSVDKHGKKFTFERLFYQKKTERSNRPGTIWGWPMIGMCWANNRLKLNALRRIDVETSGAVHYIGIAADEPRRIQKHEKRPNIRMPLVEAGWTEADCKNWCKENCLLSPTYSYAARSGCFFCAEQPFEQLMVLRNRHPDLWRMMLQWDADSPFPFRAPHHKNQTGQWLYEIEDRFSLQESKTGKKKEGV